MDKFKVCPSCGEHNAPTMIECVKCEADLTNVNVVDINSVNQGNIVNIKNEMIRVCECGNENLSSARKCVKCGEDISDIIPTKKCECTPKFLLTSIEGDFILSLTNEVTLVGREQEMSEYLSSKTFVSRRHAKFIIKDDTLFIINLSETNFTYVNNIKIASNFEMTLKDGDEIGFGGSIINGQRQQNAAYLIVRINQCI